jgi:hypothetical protein
MPSAGIEPAIPTMERPQTQALDRAATGIGRKQSWHNLRHELDIRLEVLRRATKIPLTSARLRV